MPVMTVGRDLAAPEGVDAACGCRISGWRGRDRITPLIRCIVAAEGGLVTASFG